MSARWLLLALLLGACVAPKKSVRSFTPETVVTVKVKRVAR